MFPDNALAPIFLILYNRTYLSAVQGVTSVKNAKYSFGVDIAILNHNVTSAYLVPSDLYEKMMDIIDDYTLAKEVDTALKYKDEDLVEVNIDEL